MKITTKLRGIDQVYASLRNVAERVPENGRRVMRRGAEAIVEEARLNAPVDKHNLEQSIRAERDRGTRGRLQIDVVAGGFVNGVNVDRYAAEVHENYESMTPGPSTTAKREANPDRYIGSKYLERAVEEQKEKLQRAIINTSVKVIRNET